MLIVQVSDFGNDGDARYRVHDPGRYMGRLDGVTVVDCHFLSRQLPRLAELADVLVLQFVNDWDYLELFLRRRAAGKITVFEGNDYFPDMRPWNPLARHWRDGTLRQLLLKYLTLADGVQTSAPELARRWKEHGAQNVTVFVNHLVEVPPLRTIPKRPLTIGWGGSPGHLADWYEIAPLLQRWLEVHPQVNLAVMTGEDARSFIQLPPERYHFESFASLEAYEAFLTRIDIGLAPLLPTITNRCRSDVKFLEYASRGVVGIFADLEPYRDSVIDGERGLLYRSNAHLIEQLNRLVEDATLRQRIREQAYDYVVNNRILLTRIGERIEWYRSLLRTERADAQLPQEIAEEATGDHRYFQLRPGPSEQKLIEALRSPSPAQATAMLGDLLQREPDYQAATAWQGLLLNNQRQYSATLNVLGSARQGSFFNGRRWGEIGRSLFNLNQRAQARAAIEKAIEANPHHLIVWQYYLRMLAAMKSRDGRELFARAKVIFSDCYPLALLGVEFETSADAPGFVLGVLEQFAPKLGDVERDAALSAFRRVILKVEKSAPPAVDVIPLLRRACESFPESALLAAELGTALFRADRADESHDQHARALVLERRANIEKEEFPSDQPVPLVWQLARHIDRVRRDSSQAP